MNEFFNASQYDVKSEAGGNKTAIGELDLISKNFVSVSLSQIAKLTRKEDGLVLYRQKINTVSTIGVVIGVEELTTKNVYMIDDYTLGAPIEVQLWKNDEDSKIGFTPPTVLEKTYIRVVGQVRYDDSKPFIIAFIVQLINDPNEIYCHFIQVIHDSIFLEKRMISTLNPAADTSMNQESTSRQADSVNPEPDLTTSGMSGFNEVQKSVLTVLNKHGRDTPYGLKRYEIKNFLPAINSKAIDNAITFLVNEGHIFSTIDEDTFKSTDL